MTITVTPASGYEVDDVTVTDRDGDDVRVTKQSDTRYTFHHADFQGRGGGQLCEDRGDDTGA